MSNEQELQLGTNPDNPDTDGDGLNDGDEVNDYKTNPLKADTDGDGLNDGPVLAGANVSFAFGQAVALTQSRSDLVILGADLACVAHALQLSRRTMDIVRQNLWWALLYNAACVPLALMGYLPAWLAGLGMATSSLFVVLNALRLALPASVRLTPQ